jgi:hypothetical protein
MRSSSFFSALPRVAVTRLVHLARVATLAPLVATAACGTFAADEATSPTPASDGGVKAPSVDGPTSASDLTNALGVFVSPSGTDNADGTAEHPLARIQAAVELASKVGKRVYVCAGTFRENVVVADSVSIVGGLNCATSPWTTGDAHSVIEAPSSPAILAKDILTATRLEGLDVKAPAAKKPSESSVALHAEHATALTVSRSHLIAGDGANGEDGVEGIALTASTSIDGKAALPAYPCPGTQISACSSPTYRPPPNAGATNTCVGAPGHAGQSGGTGGGGGMWEVVQKTAGGVAVLQFRVQAPFGTITFEPQPGGTAGLTSAIGATGADGKGGAEFGEISRAGYVPSDGTNGTSGGPGGGGAGGSGAAPPGFGNTVGAVWLGTTGASGGAGGCPGLAGTAGKGGGASIGAFLIDSPVAFDASEIRSGRGGNGGLGTFGSAPTKGGTAGANTSGTPDASAFPGGRGGTAGTSGNGGNGPSIALLHFGAVPALRNTSQAIAGKGGRELPLRARTDVNGIISSIPATPAGTSKDILAL